MDTDTCKEEQAMEYEALTYIYPDELQLISEDPMSFSVEVKPQDEVDDEDDAVAATLTFSLPPDYPNTVPIVEITSSTNLLPEDEIEITNLVNQTMEENVGMVLTHTVCATVQGLLEDLVQKHIEAEAERVRLAELAIEAALRKKEEEERDPVLNGPLCTMETFMEWKAGFDKELAEQKAIRDGDVSQSQIQGQKTAIVKKTGRQLFEENMKKLLEDEAALVADEDDIDLDSDDRDHASKGKEEM